MYKTDILWVNDSRHLFDACMHASCKTQHHRHALRLGTQPGSEQPSEPSGNLIEDRSKAGEDEKELGQRQNRCKFAYTLH